MPDEIAISELPTIKVNGKAVDTSSIDNYDQFMSFLVQAAAAAHLSKIRKYVEDRTSVGEEQNWELNITDEPKEIVCSHPSQSLYVINDGPGDIFVAINALGRTATHLYPHDQMTDNFETHKLQRFYIWSASGTVARARAKVKY